MPLRDASREGSLALPLHPAPNPRMYKVLTANTPGCVAFSLPVQRRNLRSRRNLRLSRSLHSLRRARLTRSDGFEPERRPVPGTFSRDGLRHGKTDYPDLNGPICDGRQAFRRRVGASAIDTAVSSSANMFRRADA